MNELEKTYNLTGRTLLAIKAILCPCLFFIIVAWQRKISQTFLVSIFSICNCCFVFTRCQMYFTKIIRLSKFSYCNISKNLTIIVTHLYWLPPLNHTHSGNHSPTNIRGVLLRGETKNDHLAPPTAV